MKNDISHMLSSLRMSGFAQRLNEQNEHNDTMEMSFDERLYELLNAEITKRSNSKVQRLKKSAKLKYPNAHIEDINYASERKLSRTIISNLASCNWIESNKALLLIGPTGVGKTWLASAFGVEACRKGFSTYFTSGKSLFEHIEDAIYDRKIGNFNRNLSRKNLLIIDDFGLGGMNNEFSRNLLDIIDLQQSSGGLIITSQATPKEWYKQFNDSGIADATLDRIIHRAQVINLHGDSMRKVKK